MTTDVDRRVAVARYRAICADLLPHADGSPATGGVVEVHGVDEFSFDERVSSVTGRTHA